MAPPPPVEHNNGDSTATAESQRSIPTPFLTKTYQLVEDQSIDDVISWNDDGSTFIVWNPTVFARDLLPKYFKHNNFSSFVRQLNTYVNKIQSSRTMIFMFFIYESMNYLFFLICFLVLFLFDLQGFRKVVPDRWEFSNECFRRGEKRLLCEIQRRKILSPSPTPSPPAVVVAATATATVVAAATVAVPSPMPLTTIPTAMPIISPTNSGEEQVVSSNSSPSRAPADIIDENERLRKENVQLAKELAEMRSLCNNIFSLMSNYANTITSGNSHHQTEQGSSRDSGLTAVKPLDLMPVKRSFEQETPTVTAATTTTEKVNPKLFGVAIGAKRAREGGGSSDGGGGGGISERAEEEDTLLRLHQPGHADVKSEPLDCQNQRDSNNNSNSNSNNDNNQETPWLNHCHRANQRVCNRYVELRHRGNMLD